MKKMPYFILIGEIIAICVLHSIKSNQSSEVIPSAIDKMKFEILNHSEPVIPEGNLSGVSNGDEQTHAQEIPFGNDRR